MRTQDEHGNVWEWSLGWVWGWYYLRHPVESLDLLDGGSRVWRIGFLEIRRMIQHED